MLGKTGKAGTTTLEGAITPTCMLWLWLWLISEFVGYGGSMLSLHCGLIALLALAFLDSSDSFSSLIISLRATGSARGSCCGGGVRGDVWRACQYQRWPRQCLVAPLHMSTKSNAHDRVQIAIDNFISTLQIAIEDRSFESFTLTGPVVPRKRRKSSSGTEKMNSTETYAEKLRGKFKTISGRLMLLNDKQYKKSSRTNKTGRADGETVNPGKLYVQTTIKYFQATDIIMNWEVDNQKNSDQTEVEEGLRKLFLTSMGVDTDGPLSEWGSQNISAELGILAGTLDTSDGVYKLRLHPPQNASFELSTRKPHQSNVGLSAEVNRLPQMSHDRLKNVALSPSSKFFQKLGVSNADGKPLIGMASKLRQCQKFVEIVGSLVDNVSTVTKSRIRVIDMGCGRGYLTFSLHSYLSSKYGEVQSQGIDQRPKLIHEVNGIARALGDEFVTLNFAEGAISSVTDNLFENDQLLDNSNNLDILIALHACDTATDDALWFAIARDVNIIVTAPCCQHELRPQIDRYAATNPDQPLCSILRHAIYRERATETVTDAMRAILLEIAGYETNVFEFIGGEHTAKNVMITATKINSQKSNDEKWLKARRQRLIDLAELYGIKYQRLAMLMEENITLREDEAPKFLIRNGLL